MIKVFIVFEEHNGVLETFAIAKGKNKTERENKFSLAIAHALEELKIKDAQENKESNSHTSIFWQR